MFASKTDPNPFWTAAGQKKKSAHSTEDVNRRVITHLRIMATPFHETILSIKNQPTHKSKPLKKRGGEIPKKTVSTSTDMEVEVEVTPNQGEINESIKSIQLEEIQKQIQDSLLEHDKLFLEKVHLFQHGSNASKPTAVIETKNCKLQQLANRQIFFKAKHIICSDRHWHNGIFKIFTAAVEQTDMSWKTIHDLLSSKIRASSKQSKRNNSPNPWNYKPRRKDSNIYNEIFQFLIKQFLPDEGITLNFNQKNNLKLELLSYCVAKEKKPVYELNSILQSEKKNLHSKHKSISNEEISKIIIRIYCCLLSLSEDVHVVIDILNHNNKASMLLLDENVDQKAQMLTSIWRWISLDETLDITENLKKIKSVLIDSTKNLNPSPLLLVHTRNASIPNLIIIQTIGMALPRQAKEHLKSCINELQSLLVEFYYFLITNNTDNINAIAQSIRQYDELAPIKNKYKKSNQWKKILRYLSSLNELWKNNMPAYLSQKNITKKRKTELLFQYLGSINTENNRFTKSKDLCILLAILNIKTHVSSTLSRYHRLKNSLCEKLLTASFLDEGIDNQKTNQNLPSTIHSYLKPNYSVKSMALIIENHFISGSLHDMLIDHINHFLTMLTSDTFEMNTDASKNTYLIIINLLIKHSHIDHEISEAENSWDQALNYILQQHDLPLDLLKLNLFSSPFSSFWCDIHNVITNKLFNIVVDSLNNPIKSILLKTHFTSLRLNNESEVKIILNQLDVNHPSCHSNQQKLLSAILITLSQNHLNTDTDNIESLQIGNQILISVRKQIALKIESLKQGRRPTVENDEWSSLIHVILLSDDILNTLPRFNVLKTIREITNLGIKKNIRHILLHSSAIKNHDIFISLAEADEDKDEKQVDVNAICQHILKEQLMTIKKTDMPWLEAFDIFCLSHPNFLLLNKKISTLVTNIHAALAEIITTNPPIIDIEKQISIASENFFSDILLKLQILKKKNPNKTGIPQSQWQLPFIYVMFTNLNKLSNIINNEFKKYADKIIAECTSPDFDSEFIINVNILIINAAITIQKIHSTIFNLNSNNLVPINPTSISIIQILIRLTSIIPSIPNSTTTINATNEWQIYPILSAHISDPMTLATMTMASQQALVNNSIQLRSLTYVAIECERVTQKSPTYQTANDFFSGSPVPKLKRTLSQEDLVTSTFLIPQTTQ